MMHLLAHEGHAHLFTGPFLDTLIQWLGTFHPMFVNFPVSLITMTVAAEWLYSRNGLPLYAHAARFMIVAAAIMSIPTVLFGLALSYNANYQDTQEIIFHWHRFFGLTTMALVIFTAYFREYRGRHALYLTFLAFSFLSVFVTGFLGGNLTFGFLNN